MRKRHPAALKDTLDKIQEQDSITYHQEDSEENVYPGGDAYSVQVMIFLPSKDLQLLIVRLRSMISGGYTPVKVTQTPAGPAF